MIAIITFISSLAGLDPKPEPKTSFVAITAVLWLYGWFVLSWFLARRFYLIRLRQLGEIRDSRDVAMQHVSGVAASTFLVGLILSPLWIVLSDWSESYTGACYLLFFVIGAGLFFGMPLIYPGEYDEFWDGLSDLL